MLVKDPQALELTTVRCAFYDCYPRCVITASFSCEYWVLVKDPQDPQALELTTVRCALYDCYPRCVITAEAIPAVL